MREGTVIDKLVGAVVEAMPELTESDQHIAVEIYRQLAQGQPVESREITRSTGLNERTVERFLRTQPGIFRDSLGRIEGFWGLAIPEMPHRLGVDGVGIHTWCAWDPLFIVPLLESAGYVESQDPVTGERVSLRITAKGVEEVSPPTTVVSFLMPDKPWDHDVIQGFCHYVLFFASSESGEEWVADHPGTFLLSVEEAFEVGRRTNAIQFEKVLSQSGLGAT